MKYEGIPKRILPGHEEKIVTEKKYQGMKALLEGGLDEVSPHDRPTVLDFQGLSPESTEEDFLQWIKREISISPEIISDNGKTPESKKAYEVLNYAYQQGKIFLKDTLKYKEDELSIGPEALSSKKDVFELLNKTILKGGASGLSRAVVYCRIIKATIVAYETLKNDAELVKDNTTAFENQLISPFSISNPKDTPLVLLNENEKGKNFYAKENGLLKGSVVSRAKDLEKAMLRFLTRPESSAKVALKDAIASRITIEKEQALKLLPILCNWLIEKMKVGFIKITNQDFLSAEQMDEVRKILDEFPENSFSVSEHKPDSTSMGEFESLRVLGTLQISGKDDSSISPLARQFEIQLVTPYNKNEEGKMHHSIFDVVKLMVARTRLDGGCSEGVFNEFVKDASAQSGISEKKIKYYLMEVEDAPIVKIKKKSNKNKELIFIAHSVYARWNQFRWVDNSLIKDIETAKK